MAKLHRVDQTLDDRVDFLLRQVSFFDESMFERSTSHVFQNHVQFIGVFFKIVKFDDIRMVQLFEDLDFVDQIDNIVLNKIFSGVNILYFSIILTA